MPCDDDLIRRLNDRRQGWRLARDGLTALLVFTAGVLLLLFAGLDAMARLP